jgi:hypothetical protein
VPTGKEKKSKHPAMREKGSREAEEAEEMLHLGSLTTTPIYASKIRSKISTFLPSEAGINDRNR